MPTDVGQVKPAQPKELSRLPPAQTPTGVRASPRGVPADVEHAAALATVLRLSLVLLLTFAQNPA